MDDNNTNTADTGVNTTTPAAEEKTFTQDDVNRIVQKRLAEERAKASPPADGDTMTETERTLAAKVQELEQRERDTQARSLVAARNLSPDLLGVLKYDDDASLVKALDELDKHFNYSNPNKVVIIPPPGDVPEKYMRDTAMRDAFGLK